MSNYKVYIVCSMLWNVLIFCTFMYLVFERGHSGWWFLLMIACSSGNRSEKEIRGDKGEQES